MKKLILGVLITLSAVCANAAYLYWQVTEADVAGSSQEVNAGRVWAVSSSASYDWAIANTGGDTGWTLCNLADDTSYQIFGYGGGTAVGSVIVENYYGSDYKYFVEIGHWAADTFTATKYAEVAGTSAVVYTDALSGQAAAAAAALTAYTYQTAPEPTSGLLTLVGMALLGLRRKRA